MEYTRIKTGPNYYVIYKKGKRVGHIAKGSNYWNIYNDFPWKRLAYGYPLLKEAFLAFIEINEGREPLPPSRPFDDSLTN